MRPLRLCVIGAGSWVAVSHLPNLAERRDVVEFVGVCRLGGDRLRHMQERWGFRIASEDYRVVLDLEPDIVVVASPAALHHEHAMAALQCGAHVLVEKPFTLRSGEAWALVREAARVGRHLVVSFGYNYRPAVTLAKDAFDRVGGIGAIEFASIEMSSTTRDLLAGVGSYPSADPDVPPDTATWTDPALAGGGYAHAQLTHALGALLWISGLQGEEVCAQLSNVGAPVELYTAAHVRFAGGAIGTIAGSATHRAADGRDVLTLAMTGAEGELRVECHNDAVRLFRRGVGSVAVDVPPGGGAYDCDGPVHALVDLALGRRSASSSPGDLGARTVEILEALYQSAASRQGELVGPRPEPAGSSPSRRP